MVKQKEDALAAIKYLAEQLGIKMDNQRIAITTPKEDATARLYDGSLEAKVIATLRGTVRVESPRAPGIDIELVDHQKDDLAPAGAIYRISAYMPQEGSPVGACLNGDVYCVYVGKEGLILDEPSRKRAAKLYLPKYQ